MKNLNSSGSHHLNFFREDFVQSITRSILDQIKNKLNSYSIRFQPQTLNTSNEKKSMNEKTFFELLINQEGLIEFRDKVGEFFGLNKDKILSFRLRE